MSGPGVPAAGARRHPPISPYLAEFLGVAIVLAVGLSAVSVDFGAASPVPRSIPDPVLRRLITGSIFAGTGTLVVYSVLGRISGAHLNPAMTLAFLRLGKVGPRHAAGYVVAQVGGALVAALAVSLAWGSLSRSVGVGATVPGPDGPLVAVAAEAVMTCLLVTLVLQFMVRPGLARFNGIAAGILVAGLVTVAAPISGTSLNPARSLGPAVVAGLYRDVWVYFVGPLAGALAAAALFRGRRGATIPCAKLFHTNEFACHFGACAYQRDPVGPARPRLEELPEAQPQEATT